MKPVNQCPQIRIIRIDMSVYFGSVDYIQQQLHKIVEDEKITHILIVGSGINLIDLSGAEMLATEANRLKNLGGGLYFCGLKSSVYECISKSCFVAKVGNRYFFDKKKRKMPLLPSTKILTMNPVAIVLHLYLGSAD